MPPSLVTVPYGWATRQVIKFGNNIIPIVGGIASWIDLNDGANWFAQGLEVEDKRIVQTQKLIWKSKAVFLGDDYDVIKVKVPMVYDETGGTSFQAAKAQLMQLGEQYLTMDNATAVLCKLTTYGQAKLNANSTPPYRWVLALEFTCKEPWLKDLATTTVTQGITGSTSFNITYAGNVWCEPVYTVTGITSATSLQLTNNTSGEGLTVYFGAPLPLSMTITIDTAKMKVLDQNGKEYDIFGSFPHLYPPVGTVNAFTVNPVGTATGTVVVTYNNRWSL